MTDLLTIILFLGQIYRSTRTDEIHITWLYRLSLNCHIMTIAIKNKKRRTALNSWIGNNNDYMQLRT